MLRMPMHSQDQFTCFQINTQTFTIIPSITICNKQSNYQFNPDGSNKNNSQQQTNTSSSPHYPDFCHFPHYQNIIDNFFWIPHYRYSFFWIPISFFGFHIIGYFFLDFEFTDNPLWFLIKINNYKNFSLYRDNTLGFASGIIQR